MLDSERGERKANPLLPWPAEWGNERPRSTPVLGAIFFSLAFVVFIPFSISASSAGDTLKALFGVAGCLGSLSFVAVALPHLRPRRKYLPSQISVGDLPDGSTGILLPYNRTWLPVLAAWLVVGIVVLVLRGAVVAHHLATFDSAGQSARVAIDILQLVVVVAAVAALAYVAFQLARGGRSRNFVALSDCGVRISVRGGSRALDWSEIKAVTPCIVNNYSIVSIIPASESSIKIDTGPRKLGEWQLRILRRSIDVHALTLGVDPALLLYLVRFYWQHPESRGELSSDAVIDRMRRGEL